MAAQVFDKLEQAVVVAKQVGQVELDTAALQVSGLKALVAR